MVHKILVIDDEPNVRKVISARLSSAGFEVMCASNGYEGIGMFVEALYKDPFSLIILDIMMPGLGGLETLDFIRKEEEIRGVYYGEGTPVIMLTALKKPYMQAFGRGCDDYMIKPYQPEDLLKKVEEKIALRFS